MREKIIKYLKNEIKEQEKWDSTSELIDELYEMIDWLEK